MSGENTPLAGVRVLAALNGLELFGHERGNIEVFKALRDQGAEVLVGVSSEPDNNVRDELDRLGFPTLALPFGKQWSIQWVRREPSIAVTNVLAVLRCSSRFYGATRRFCPTHFHLGSELVYSYVSLALALSRVPLVFRIGDRPSTNSPFNLRILQMALRRTSRIISNCEFVRFWTLKACGKESSVIHNLAPERVDTRGAIGERPNQDQKENLVFVGSVAEHKGLVPLVEALAQLVQEHPALRLDIVGGSRWDAAFRGELERLVVVRGLESRVNFRGHVDDPSSFYRRAAIHVAPSNWEEAAGTVVLEAKREGTPSVIFPSGGLLEVVRHQVDGYVCRERSADALVEGLRWMLSDRPRLLRMGEAARDDSEARFGRQRFARAWADVYRSAVRGQTESS